MRTVRFRTLGCYPLTGRGRERRGDARGDRRRDAADDDLRAAGPGDRPRRRQRVDGEEEAGGLFLMAARRRRPASPTDIDAYLDAHEHKSLLRFITCGSVDDGKSTLIGRLLYESQADLRGPARRARSRQQAARHAGRRDRLRAAGRRPVGRARAGHHHRRRLPLLRHRRSASSSSPTRRATSSTRATWSPAPRPPTSRCSWSMRARAC